MGLDLTLLPFNMDDGGWCFSSTVLPLNRDRCLWAAIDALPARPVPSGFRSYCGYSEAAQETRYGKTATDAYGTPLTCVTVADLLTLSDHPCISRRERRPSDVGWAPEGPQWDEVRRLALADSGPDPLTVAAWAYLAALPPATKVALYWH